VIPVSNTKPAPPGFGRPAAPTNLRVVSVTNQFN
jgi:hypothetical protein